MKIIQLRDGMLDSNSFIVSKGNECAVIDTGVKPSSIIDAVGDMTIKYIILTHGHVDHMYYTEQLRDQTGAKVCIHSLDSEKLVNGKANLSFLLNQPIEGREADHILSNGDELMLDELTLKIIHTPGHTPGGICIYADGHIFSGDSIFHGAFGRTDFPGGSDKDLFNSISNILNDFPDETVIHSGHGEDTTVGLEKRINPYKEFLLHD